MIDIESKNACTNVQSLMFYLMYRDLHEHALRI